MPPGSLRMASVRLGVHRNRLWVIFTQTLGEKALESPRKWGESFGCYHVPASLAAHRMGHGEARARAGPTKRKVIDCPSFVTVLPVFFWCCWALLSCSRIPFSWPLPVPLFACHSLPVPLSCHRRLGLSAGMLVLTDSSWAFSLPGLEFATISLKLCLLQAPTLRITFFQDSRCLHSRWFFLAGQN